MPLITPPSSYPSIYQTRAKRWVSKTDEEKELEYLEYKLQKAIKSYREAVRRTDAAILRLRLLEHDRRDLERLEREVKIKFLTMNLIEKSKMVILIEVTDEIFHTFVKIRGDPQREEQWRMEEEYANDRNMQLEIQRLMEQREIDLSRGNPMTFREEMNQQRHPDDEFYDRNLEQQDHNLQQHGSGGDHQLRSEQERINRMNQNIANEVRDQRHSQGYDDHGSHHHRSQQDRIDDNRRNSNIRSEQERINRINQNIDNNLRDQKQGFDDRGSRHHTKSEQERIDRIKQNIDENLRDQSSRQRGCSRSPSCCRVGNNN
ncbi:uncharacterized protein MELLADRAFT_69894 [Melampsora larici-populina 98AG31]|uniref:Uncharacterized protein n=1 Tax=Melampsora larici-populina (strain 98AG31 / pathotype 3-4-7) TaxID=747676 RepID=F4SCN9_MELLP|nr:uncharacterized protein MELLADRAFT_69894 [Melampsora larici-populina 98AG31]EGF97593.1 hypothetical protein MELLADRAFT_69894 [Melampsora larici-populina 98AG31]